jgi:hypothetical protein
VKRYDICACALGSFHADVCAWIYFDLSRPYVSEVAINVGNGMELVEMDTDSIHRIHELAAVIDAGGTGYPCEQRMEAVA